MVELMQAKERYEHLFDGEQLEAGLREIKSELIKLSTVHDSVLTELHQH